jgi:hypothetical protein
MVRLRFVQLGNISGAFGKSARLMQSEIGVWEYEMIDRNLDLTTESMPDSLY